VGALPVDGSDEEKRTNEIGTAIPLLETCDLTGKDITGDALLTQRRIATYLSNRGPFTISLLKAINRRWKAIYRLGIPRSRRSRLHRGLAARAWPH
jgi:hypothetical protein